VISRRTTPEKRKDPEDAAEAEIERFIKSPEDLFEIILQVKFRANFGVLNQTFE
jgi:hypothetical protein